MRKLLALVALAAGFAISGAARAADVDIEINQTTATDWSLLVDNHSGTALGGINMFVSGLNVFTVNAANTGISAPDTTLSIDPLGDGVHNFLVINNVAGQTIAAAGASGVLLGTLSGPGPVTAQGAEGLAGSPTLFDINLNATNQTFSFLIHPLPSTPEPGSLLLLGVGLGSLALLRRKA